MFWNLYGCIVHVVPRPHIYLWSNVVCLFCFVLMRSSKPECFILGSWSLWIALEGEGCIGLVHDVWTCGAKVLEYWIFFSLKIKLNDSWNFGGVRFGFKMWEILIFKWFLPLKIQINSKKSGFERKNRLRKW
jgi:hypothetical protein